MDKVEQIQALLAQTLADMKAEDVLTYRSSDALHGAEYVLIATGSSTRHVKALARSVHRVLKKLRVGRLHLEGEANGEWVLIDAAEVVVHVMQPHIRQYYDLERLWCEAGASSSI